MSGKIGIAPGVGTKRRGVGTDVGVQRPEVEVGVLLVHGVGALRSGTPGPGRGRAAGGGEPEEAAAQGGRSRPSHAALGSRRLLLLPPPCRRVDICHTQQWDFVNLPFFKMGTGHKKLS